MANRREQHDGHHHHGDATRHVTTRDGLLTLEVFEDGVPPRWRVRSERGPLPDAQALTVQTLRAGGAAQTFTFAARDGFLESLDAIPEPHAFVARLHVTGPAGAETHDLAFAEHDHDHGSMGLGDNPGDNLGDNFGDADDAHARAHAEDIRRRFAGRSVTTGQIVMFGLTGGLIPCPAAITVLLMCIQLKQLSLGFVLVVCFSLGLAVTMVSAGVLAALSVKHVAGRWSGFGAFARRAPYASAALIVLVGLYTGWLGWDGLRQGHRDQAAQRDPAGVAMAR